MPGTFKVFWTTVTHTHTHTHTCIQTHTFHPSHTHPTVPNTRHTHTPSHTLTHTHTHTHTSHTQTHTSYTYSHSHTDTHTPHTHAYKHTQAHTHANRHTHTHTQSNDGPLSILFSLFVFLWLCPSFSLFLPFFPKHVANFSFFSHSPLALPSLSAVYVYASSCSFFLLFCVFFVWKKLWDDCKHFFESLLLLFFFFRKCDHWSSFQHKENVCTQFTLDATFLPDLTTSEEGRVVQSQSWSAGRCYVWESRPSGQKVSQAPKHSLSSLRKIRRWWNVFRMCSCLASWGGCDLGREENTYLDPLFPHRCVDQGVVAKKEKWRQWGTRVPHARRQDFFPVFLCPFWWVGWKWTEFCHG